MCFGVYQLLPAIRLSISSMGELRRILSGGDMLSGLSGRAESRSSGFKAADSRGTAENLLYPVDKGRSAMSPTVLNRPNETRPAIIQGRSQRPRSAPLPLASLRTVPRFSAAAA